MLEAALILLLAQTCAAEIGIQPNGERECLVMWEINARTADRKNWTLEHQTRAFNAYWRHPHKSRKWIRGLRLDGEAPDNWLPSYGPWRRFQGLWARYVNAARDFVYGWRRGIWEPLCPPADDYGGTPGDGVGADDKEPCKKAVRISCIPGERQAYWNTRACRRR